MGKHASQPITQELARSQEYRVKTHQQTAIFGRRLRDIGEVGQGGWRETTLGEDAQHKQGHPQHQSPVIAITSRVNTYQGNTSYVDTQQRNKHQPQTRHMTKKK